MACEISVNFSNSVHEFSMKIGIFSTHTPWNSTFSHGLHWSLVILSTLRTPQETIWRLVSASK